MSNIDIVADLPSLHHILALEEVSGWNGSTTSST